MKVLRYWDKKDKEDIKSIIKRDFLSSVTPDLISKVSEIIKEVRECGDKALFKYADLYDRVELNRENVKVKEKEFLNAQEHIEDKFYDSLVVAKKNIIEFHEKQKVNSWREKKEENIILGQLCSPIDKVGIYIPGGSAPLVSTVLMTTIPALVAGVNEIIICTPVGKKGIVNPYILASAELLGIRNVYKVGGAQAIAALAYGTESIPGVDKIVGPGNIYVTIAKKLVYGKVSIDMIAGPSEILILADESAKANFVASDLLSQAEHDELSSSVLVTTSKALSQEVIKEISLQKEKRTRKDIIEISLQKNGTIILVKNIEEGIDIVNNYAPEHLELCVKEPWKYLSGIKQAGAIFIGNYTPESVGDYIAGPSHVLPTAGSARFYSPLSVDDFITKSSLIYYSKEALNKYKKDITNIANLEGLDAHAYAVEVRS
ncbi:MAG: histidinol dehydrogenase [bacterium]|nr:histidinol dehydrogenase [bacterium]